MTQGFRASQFIYTYGPGSILEGQNGPRMVLSANQGLFHPKSAFKVIDNYRINDERMSKNLLNGNNIYRLPNNAEEGMRDDEAIYLTNAFPLWNLCINANGHTAGNYVLYQGNECPVCHHAGGGREAIRFVRACKNGHLDEIDWNYLVHRSSKENHAQHYLYNAGAGSISDIRISCPTCGVEKEFGKEYYGESPCSGRFPERERHGGNPARNFGSCNAPMKILQRNAANIRLSKILTLLSIKSSGSALHNIFQRHEIAYGLGPLKDADALPKDMPALEKFLDGLVNRETIKKITKDEIMKHDWEAIKPIMNQVTEPIPSMTYSELILDEFKELMKGSNDGIPAVKSSRDEVYFEMIPQYNRKFTCENGTTLRVCPVTKLSTISVQTGYSREPTIDDTENAQEGHVVNYSDDPGERFRDTNNKTTVWYPGVINRGEGLFIRLDENDGWHKDLRGNASSKWLDSFENGMYPKYLFRDETSKEETDPLFVWWHSLSHLLIRAIGEDSGFSSASVRERVYVERKGDRARGGILLYATQAGADGSLGGLLALAPYLDRMLEIAFDKLRSCSGDPLCIETNFETNNVNGACCFGCMMNSETSCEHRNLWLDRHILLDNMP